jgi:hypothetical protein
MNTITRISHQFCGSSIVTLKELDLSHNNLTQGMSDNDIDYFHFILVDSIPPGAFQHISSLRSLSLSGNEMHKLPDHIEALKVFRTD